MKNSQIVTTSLFNALGTTIYVSGVAWLLMNGEKIFGPKPGILGVVSFLMLFLFSALITSLLILGRPIYMYVEGKKKEAVTLLVCTVAWLAIFITMLITYITIKR